MQKLLLTETWLSKVLRTISYGTFFPPHQRYALHKYLISCKFLQELYPVTLMQEFLATL